jgi:hypothetical protein
VIKKREFLRAARGVAVNGEGAREFMSRFSKRIRIKFGRTTRHVCIHALQFGFEKDPEMGVNVVGIIPGSVEVSISFVAGDEFANQIMETIHRIAPIVKNAAVWGVHVGQ